jgi:hypothetical protein
LAILSVTMRVLMVPRADRGGADALRRVLERGVLRVTDAPCLVAWDAPRSVRYADEAVERGVVDDRAAAPACASGAARASCRRVRARIAQIAEGELEIARVREAAETFVSSLLRAGSS